MTATSIQGTKRRIDGVNYTPVRGVARRHEPFEVVCIGRHLWLHASIHISTMYIFERF